MAQLASESHSKHIKAPLSGPPHPPPWGPRVRSDRTGHVGQLMGLYQQRNYTDGSEIRRYEIFTLRENHNKLYHPHTSVCWSTAASRSLNAEEEPRLETAEPEHVPVCSCVFWSELLLTLTLTFSSSVCLFLHQFARWNVGQWKHPSHHPGDISSPPSITPSQPGSGPGHHGSVQ